MRMKKTLSIIMAASLAAFTMVGCSQSTINYSKELSDASKWETTNSDMQGSVNFEVAGQNVQLNFTSTGYSVGSDKAYADMKFSDPSGKINIPEVKVYVDGGTSYINKSYYEDIYTLSGQAIPTGLANLNADYIGIDSGMDMGAMRTLISKPDALVQLGKMIFGNSDIDLPYVQNGREYTLNLDTNQTVDLVGKATKGIINNLDNVNTTFKLGLTAEDIQQTKTSMNDQSFDTGLAQAKIIYAGSTISEKEVFADDNYKQDLNINLQIKDWGKVSIQLTGTSTKSAAKEITMPTNTVKLTQEELNKLLTPETVTTSTNTAA